MIFSLVGLLVGAFIFVSAFGEVDEIDPTWIGIEDKSWKPSDFYFASDLIQIDNGRINKYDDYRYGVVSRISLELNNSNLYLTNKKVNITIAYPKGQEFLDLNVNPRNPSEDKLFEENDKYIPKEPNIISKDLKEDKTESEKYSDVSNKIDSLSIEDEGKQKLEIEKLDGYEFKTFEVEFKDDEGYMIRGYVSSEYGLNEKLYIYIEGSFAGGSGTSGDPWEIETWAQLNETRDNLSASYILMNDLDSSSTGYDTYASSSANSGAGWNAVSTFTGIFDGGNHTISDLYISRDGIDNQGLFGYTHGATISNVGLVNCNITGGDDAGTLIGYVLSSTITNSYSTGNLKNGNDGPVGGFTGRLVISSSAINCYTLVNVNTTYGYEESAGFIGYAHTSTITNGYSTGTVGAED